MKRKLIGVLLVIGLMCILLSGLSFAAGEMFSGVEDTAVPSGATFDCMAGVTAENGGTALDIEVTDIVASDGSLTFSAGMTSFTASLTAGVTYTITYDAYDPADTLHTNSLDTATRTVTVVGEGEIEVDSAYFSAAQTTYNYYDADAKTFTVRYTVSSSTQSKDVVLIVKCPEYGTTFAALPTSNTAVEEAVLIDSRTAAIRLRDGLTSGSDASIEFALAHTALTQAQAEQWMDNGSLPTTTIEAASYIYGGDYTTAEANGTLEKSATLCTMTLENYSAANIEATHTYHVDISSVTEIANYCFDEGYDKEYMPRNYDLGPDKNSSLRYNIPVAHVNDAQLIEINSIKVYCPNNELELIGIKDTTVTTLSSTESSNATDLIASDFDAQWSGWTVSDMSSDANGNYYIITPTSRWFNIGDDDSLTDAFYGMRLIWQVADGETLSYSDTEVTPLTGADTVVTYKVCGGSEETYTHTGAQVDVRQRTDNLELTHAYNPSREVDNTDANVVIAGIDYSNEEFTYTTNTHYMNKSSQQEYVPAYTDAITQTFTFPDAIQPTGLTLSNYGLDNNNYLSYSDIDIESARYQTEDGVWHNFTDDDITAINAYYAFYDEYYRPDDYSNQPEAVTVSFTEASDTNWVTAVELNWANMYTYGVQGWGATPLVNSGVGTNTQLIRSRKVADVVTAFSYHVDENASGMQQVGYELTMSGNAANNETQTAAEDRWLWFDVVQPPLPELYGVLDITGDSMSNAQLRAYNWIYYPDAANWETTGDEYSAGDIYLYVGQEDSHIDEMVNPVIEVLGYANGYYFERVDGSVVDSSQRGMTNVSDEEVLGFLSGRMTAAKYLAGWDIEFTTNLRITTQVYSIPAITEDTAIDLGIDLENGEYLTSLYLTYNGTFMAVDDDAGEHLDTIEMLKDVMICARSTNPVSGEIIKFDRVEEDWDTEDRDRYGVFFVSLDGTLTCDNGSGTQYMEPVLVEYGNVYWHFRPAVALYLNRYLYLEFMGATDQETADIPQVYQGQSTSLTHTVSINVTDWSSEYGINQFYLDGRVNFGQAPWDISEAVYIELTDSEFLPDASTTSLYGVPVGENLTMEVVTVSGRRFIKLQFTEGFLRDLTSDVRGVNDVVFDEEKGVYFYYSGKGVVELGGDIQIGLKSLAGCTLGTHNPLGEVYLDYSELVERYDAPVDTASDNITRTDWRLTDAVEDTLGLSDTDTTGDQYNSTEKLFKYDLSSYEVNVLKASSLSANIVPGEGDVYEWDDYLVEFTPDERDDLQAMYTITAPDSNDLYDFVGYIKLPRDGVSCSYLDEANNLLSEESEYDVYLTGVPTVLSDSTAGLPDNIHYAYTTDSDPDESSTYNETLPADLSTVTGIRIVVDQLPRDGAISWDIPLSAEEKTTLGTMDAYIGGVYTYRLDSATGDINDGYLPLGTYELIDYNVAQTSLVWYDTYDENGTQGQTTEDGSAYEIAAGGITVNLYDTDGTTLIDTAVTDSNGSFSLSSYKNDAGQVLEIVMPDYAVPGDSSSGLADWVLTALSAVDYDLSLYDSDFDRTTLKMTLPELTAAGLENISAGLVRLPELDAGVPMLYPYTPPSHSTQYFENVGTSSDPVYQRIDYEEFDTDSYYMETLELYEGETASITAVLRDYFDDELPSGNAYNITYVQVNDASIATASPTPGNIELTGTSATAYNEEISITGVSEGSTYIEIQTTNVLGDVVTTRAYITVLDVIEYEMPNVIMELTGDPYTGFSKTFSAEVDKGDSGYPDADNMSGTTSAFTAAGSETLPDFGSMSFNEIGTYTYTFGQTIPATPEAYLDYDLSEYTLTIEITDTDGDGTLEINAVIVKTVDEDGNAIAEADQVEHTGDITFTNNYEPVAYTYTLPDVQKTLASTSGELPSGFSAAFTANAEPTDAGWPAVDTGTGSVTMTSQTTSSFSALGTVEITAPGDYAYAITETQGVMSGMDYDLSEYTISFSVVDNAGTLELDGSVVITKTKDSTGAAVNETVTSVSFENEYTPEEDTYSIPAVTKTIEGNVPAGNDKEFSFTVSPISTTAVGLIPSTMPMPANATATITGEGTTLADAFGDIAFTEAGTYVYYLSEDALSPAADYVGYGHDDTVYVITITVTDHYGNLVTEGIVQKLTTPGAVEVSTIEFTNTYTPEETEAYTTPAINKTISTDATIPDDKTFTFSMAANSFTAAAGSSATLTAAEMPMPSSSSVTTSGAGMSASFGTMTFEHAGTYIYRITEDNLPASGYGGYTKDSTIYELTITVVDNDGELEISTTTVVVLGESTPVDISSGIPFENTYDPEDVGYTIPLANKVVSGDATPSDKTFSFTIEADGMTGVPSTLTTQPMPSTTEVSVTGTGDATAFGTIDFTSQGVYTYTITENDLPDGCAGYTKDTTVYMLTVTVTDTDGTLTAVGVISGGTYAEKFVFNNEYEKQTVVSADPPVSKTISGDTPIIDETFEFKMEAISYTAPSGSVVSMTPVQMPMPTGSNDGVKEITITGAGSKEFGEYTYEIPGAYVYEISEVTGTNTQYDYSELVYTITDVVAYNADGTLGYTRTISRSDDVTYTETDGYVFDNQYTLPIGSLTIKKTVSGDLADAEKLFTFTVIFDADGSYTYTGDYSGTISSGGTIQLKHGESIVITGLPAGTAYTVTESNYGDYKQTSTGSSGVILADLASTASFVNTLSSVPKTGDDKGWIIGLLMIIVGVVGFGLVAVLRYRRQTFTTKRIRR